MRTLRIAVITFALVASCGPTGYRAAASAGQGQDAARYAVLPNASAAVSQATNSVHIVDFAFSPPALTVPAGSTVTWTNTGAATHTTTADNGAWNSGPLRPGMTFAQTFATAGTFSYHCMIHPSMLGTVTVTAATTPAGTPATTVVSAAAVAGQTLSVTLAAGWQIVAGPAGTTVSGNNGPLYTYRAGDTAYETVPSGGALSAGQGYWAYFNTAGTESLPSTSALPAGTPLPANQWIMVGNPTNSSVAVIGADSLLTYNTTQGYVQTTTLMAGQGAWAFSFRGGTLTMTGG